MRVLFVTRDNGGFNVARPVAEAFKTAGHEVRIAAEMYSIQRWHDAGWKPSYAANLEIGSREIREGARAVLANFKPELVITAFGGPIGIEEEIGLAANQADIPLVGLEDIWGVSFRSQAIPNLLFTLDEAGIKMLSGREVLKGTIIKAYGQPALSDLALSRDDEKAVHELRKKHGRLIVFGGEGDGSIDILHVLLMSLLQTNQDYFAIIPRFHPTERNDKLHMLTLKRHLELFDRVRPGHIIYPDIASADVLATLCDMTVSGVSTLLLYAAMNQRMAVSVDTEWLRELLKTKSLVPWSHFPGIDSGIACHLTGPVHDLFARTVIEAHEILENQRRYFSRPVMAPDEIMYHILKLAH